MNFFLAALQFFTVLPISKGFNEKEIGGTLPYFPSVGLVLGLIVMGAYLGLSFVLSSPLLLAFLMVALLAWLTGGLHLDGLADTCDGLWSARDKERILEIMRDSRIGAMGVLGLIFILGLKVISLSLLKFDLAWKALLLAPIFSRTLMVGIIYFVPYARISGMAKIFCDHKRLWHVLIAFSFSLALGFSLLQLYFLLPLCFCLLAVGAMLFRSYKLIGGMTGDVLGASAELVEAVFFFSLTLIGG